MGIIYQIPLIKSLNKKLKITFKNLQFFTFLLLEVHKYNNNNNNNNNNNEYIIFNIICVDIIY